MSAVLEYPQKHPITAEEYLRMGEAGVFAPEARLELIEGEILSVEVGQRTACAGLPEVAIEVRELFPG